MNAPLAEFIGTIILIVLGNGVVANVCLSKTKGHQAGWIVIAAGWGVAVFVGALCSEKVSGAHLNPAVTIAMAIAGELPTDQVAGYLIAQMGGAIVGGMLVYCFYHSHFAVTHDADAKLGCFCTAPNIRGPWQAFFCEVLATFVLIFAIFLASSPSFNLKTEAGIDQKVAMGMGTLGLIPVGLIVFGIGLSLGGTTGYAINPARDLGPRIAHFFLPIPGKRDSDWSYAWVPVVGPIAGGIIAAVIYKMIA